MIETIERLRLARVRVLAVFERSTGDDVEILRKVIQDIHVSIIELERVQAAAESFAPTFEAFVKTIRKAMGVKNV